MVEVLVRKLRALPLETRQKIYEYSSLVISLIAAIVWIVRISLFPPIPFILALLAVEFVVLEISLAIFVYFHVAIWKTRIKQLRQDILQAVIFRRKTPVPGLADKFNVSVDSATEVLTYLVQSGQVTGEIKQNVFYLAERKNPTCQLCDQEIEMNDRLLTCPYCHTPFHKDHLIEYINEVKERCPYCQNRLTIADLFG
ncbi:MAG TPA: hypothetical protein VKK79_15795 [Candidatus Lokiarchaeia archaeon]|nr:hypothetical protein [Candidatus Lokiarchaeia archaeon]